MTWDGIERRKCNLNDSCPHAEKVDDVHRAVFGNGHPEEGLIWIAKKNQEIITANTEFITFLKRHFWKMIAWMSLGVLAASGSFVLNLIKAHIIVGLK